MKNTDQFIPKKLVEKLINFADKGGITVDELNGKQPQQALIYLLTSYHLNRIDKKLKNKFVVDTNISFYDNSISQLNHLLANVNPEDVDIKNEVKRIIKDIENYGNDIVAYMDNRADDQKEYIEIHKIIMKSNYKVDYLKFEKIVNTYYLNSIS